MTQTLSKAMKAVAIDRFGGVETLETQELRTELRQVSSVGQSSNDRQP